MSVTQRTLTGEETDAERERPDTFLYVPETGEWILRSDRHKIDHTAVEPDEHFGSSKSTSNDGYGMYGADEKVGGVFDVRIHQTVEYAFTVPAYSKHKAKEIAKDWMLDAKPADAYTVHTETREEREIFRDELPDDWEEYEERVYDALQRMNKDESA